MQLHESFSVLIETDNDERGSGLLYYQTGSDNFYVLTCAHVIYHADKAQIHVITSDESDESIVTVEKENFYFSPIDHVDEIGHHSCDIAIIQCHINGLLLKSTNYCISPVKEGQSVTAVGYPPGSEMDPLLYRQDHFDAVILRNINRQNYFQIRVDDQFLNASDREAELQGFSGSPLWDEDGLKNGVYFLTGLVSSGTGNNVSRSRINVMNARLLQSMLYNQFGISIETRIPSVPETDIAPGYKNQVENEDQKVIRTTWIEDERNKARAFLDNIQLQKAINECRKTISNSEFNKCTTEQQYKVYAVMISAYRLARDFDKCDEIQEEMHQHGISNKREDLTSAVRYYEQLDFKMAEQYSEKALINNPDGLEEKVLSVAIKAESDQNSDPSIFADIIDKKDQLLVKPKDKNEEATVYQLLGFVFANRFRDSERAIRCLNRSYQDDGSAIVLESLACAYYQYSLRDAYIDKNKDLVDQSKIDREALDKSRDLFLRILYSGDEMWIKGTFRRAGFLLFKCFWFEQDEYRICRHYHDVMKYCESADEAQLRDLQICYLSVAIRNKPMDIESFTALTTTDRKYFKIIQLLTPAMRTFDSEGYDIKSINENELANLLSDVERQLNELRAETSASSINLDNIVMLMINLYGVGVKCFNWTVLGIMKSRLEEIKQPYVKESLSIYIHELEDNDLKKTELKYKLFFEKHNDVISFTEWCHFYTRNQMFNKTKELYDSVFTTRRYLIKNQSDFFYRSYISFYLIHDFDLTAPLRCFVEHSSDIKDPFIRLCLEIDLKYATCCFNDPDQILDDLKILLDEDVIGEPEYKEKCLIVNMLNCRFNEAEKYSTIPKETDQIEQLHGSRYEQMLFILNKNTIGVNPNWEAMIWWKKKDIDALYSQERWLLSPIEILEKYHSENRKIIVIDLWAMYYLVKMRQEDILKYFDKVYVTHNSVSDAIVEKWNSSDKDVQRALYFFGKMPNVIIQSPTLEEQLELRNNTGVYSTIKSSLLLADKYNCPALIGDFRFEIPEEYKKYIIRPNQAITIGKYMDLN